MGGLKVLVIGSGGREHAIVRKLHRDALRSGRTLQLYAAPGNPGIERLATCVRIAANALDELLAFALSEGIGLTIVGPEEPLALGIVDRFTAQGLRIFGPTAAAARLESSKSYAKAEMQKAGVPTPMHEEFTDLRAAMSYIQELDPPIVVKADGLAAGKGVTVAETTEEAEQALRMALLARTFGAAGDKVLIEQYLRGTELSVMAFVDRSGYRIMPAIRDHKRALEDDEGPNTGGMGTYAPVGAASEAVMRVVHERIFGRMMEHFRREHITYRGVLYAGLIVLNQMAYVIEFNCRFGDPETQVALELMESDLLDAIEAVLEDRVAGAEIRWSGDAAVCVVLAAGGYPGTYRKGDVIDGLAEFEKWDRLQSFSVITSAPAGGVTSGAGSVAGKDGREPVSSGHDKAAPDADALPAVAATRAPLWKRLIDRMFVPDDPPVPTADTSRARPPVPASAYVLHAGTSRREDGRVVTAGGRVLNIVGRAGTLAEARRVAYDGVARVHFTGRHFRGDIGGRE